MFFSETERCVSLLEVFVNSFLQLTDTQYLFELVFSFLNYSAQVQDVFESTVIKTPLTFRPMKLFELQSFLLTIAIKKITFLGFTLLTVDEGLCNSLAK